MDEQPPLQPVSAGIWYQLTCCIMGRHAILMPPPPTTIPSSLLLLHCASLQVGQRPRTEQTCDPSAARSGIPDTFPILAKTTGGLMNTQRGT